jgi:hypothetical protein
MTIGGMNYEEMQRLRRENLAAIVGPERRGAIAEFARAHNLDATLISQLLNGHRSFTENQARDIEAAAKLPMRSLDGGAALEPGSMAEIEDVFARADWLDSDARSYLMGLIRVMHEKGATKGQ